MALNVLKVTNLSHLIPIWSTLGPNLTSLIYKLKVFVCTKIHMDIRYKNSLWIFSCSSLHFWPFQSRQFSTHYLLSPGRYVQRDLDELTGRWESWEVVLVLVRITSYRLGLVTGRLNNKEKLTFHVSIHRHAWETSSHMYTKVCLLLIKNCLL